MKLRAILNAVTAILSVAMLYVFSLCMVPDIDTDGISEEYAYSKETTTETETLKPMYDEAYEYSEQETVRTSADDETKFSVPQGVTVPNAAPSEELLAQIKLADAEASDGDYEEITDENYNENSILYSGFSDDELDKIFSEEDNIGDYKNAAASVADGSSKNNEKSRTRLSYTKTVSSGGVNADMINSGSVSVSASSVGEADFTEGDVSDIPRVNTVSGGEIIDPSLYEALENGCGETLTAKVHGEIQDFDAYRLVCMITANEVSPSFNLEAIKAQAVAAYSYVRYHNENNLTAAVLVKEDVPDEIKYAVASVWGKRCCYNGRTAQTVYTASTSGYSASAQSVWGGDEVPYLSGRECSFDRDFDPNYGVKETFTADEIRSKLESRLNITLSDDPNDWITVTAYENGNYVKSVNIDGQTSVSGRELREKILNFGIKSAAFRVSYDDGEFTFTTYGYGHGVGMSQNGANYLAGQGWGYIDILKYYYEGITIE